MSRLSKKNELSGDDLHKAKKLVTFLMQDHPKGHAKRYNEDKLNYADLPWTGLIDVAKVTTFGAKKYDRFNWQQGFPMSQLMDSTMRHLIGDCTHLGVLTGERYDSESGLEHLSHACWNLLAIMHQLKDNDKYKLFLDMPGYNEQNTD